MLGSPIGRRWYLCPIMQGVSCVGIGWSSFAEGTLDWLLERDEDAWEEFKDQLSWCPLLIKKDSHLFR